MFWQLLSLFLYVLHFYICINRQNIYINNELYKGLANAHRQNIKNLDEGYVMIYVSFPIRAPIPFRFMKRLGTNVSFQIYHKPLSLALVLISSILYLK